MPGAGFWAIPSAKLVFRKDGRWYADGEPVTHERLARFFTRYLRRKPDGSGYEIWVDERFHMDVEIEHTPYVVTALFPGPEEQLHVRLNDESEEPLDPKSLQVASDGAVVCLVKGGRERARFLRAAQADLAPYLDEHDGQWCLHWAGNHYPIGHE
ncbi:MAG: hypothetical protein KatS3mg077_1853 [Candidatus Binatia bacterium]|nr:MAG: hypothetical protein KatS3mg077_1853 [Candidatus Binatia bacterium]